MTSRILSNLYVGTDSDATHFEFPMEPIQSIIDLRGWNAEEDIPHEDFVVVNKVLKMIEFNIINEIPTLVHCHGGMDRSPFIIACYLYEKYRRPGYDENDAYEYVKEKHPPTIVHDDWMNKFRVVTKQRGEEE